MAIPPFGGNGMLPLGEPCPSDDGEILHYGHHCTLGEVDAVLHESFSLSQTRPVLFRELEMLVTLASDILSSCSLWVSGSFVVDTDNPPDMFVVLQVLGDVLGKADRRQQWLLGRIFDDGTYFPGEEEGFKVQMGICRLYPPGHARYELGCIEQKINRQMAGDPLGTSVPGGYLQIFYDEGGLEDFDAILGSSTNGSGSSAASQ